MSLAPASQAALPQSDKKLPSSVLIGKQSSADGRSAPFILSVNGRFSGYKGPAAGPGLLMLKVYKVCERVTASTASNWCTGTGTVCAWCRQPCCRAADNGGRMAV